MKEIVKNNNYIITYENIYSYNNYTIITIFIFFILLFFYILVILKL